MILIFIIIYFNNYLDSLSPSIKTLTLKRLYYLTDEVGQSFLKYAQRNYKVYKALRVSETFVQERPTGELTQIREQIEREAQQQLHKAGTEYWSQIDEQIEKEVPERLKNIRKLFFDRTIEYIKKESIRKIKEATKKHLSHIEEQIEREAQQRLQEERRQYFIQRNQREEGEKKGKEYLYSLKKAVALQGTISLQKVFEEFKYTGHQSISSVNPIIQEVGVSWSPSSLSSTSVDLPPEYKKEVSFEQGFSVVNASSCPSDGPTTDSSPTESKERSLARQSFDSSSSLSFTSVDLSPIYSKEEVEQVANLVQKNEIKKTDLKSREEEVQLQKDQLVQEVSEDSSPTDYLHQNQFIRVKRADTTVSSSSSSSHSSAEFKQQPYRKEVQGLILQFKQKRENQKDKEKLQLKMITHEIQKQSSYTMPRKKRPRYDNVVRSVSFGYPSLLGVDSEKTEYKMTPSESLCSSRRSSSYNGSFRMSNSQFVSHSSSYQSLGSENTLVPIVEGVVANVFYSSSMRHDEGKKIEREKKCRPHTAPNTGRVPRKKYDAWKSRPLSDISRNNSFDSSSSSTNSSYQNMYDSSRDFSLDVKGSVQNRCSKSLTVDEGKEVKGKTDNFQEYFSRDAVVMWLKKAWNKKSLAVIENQLQSRVQQIQSKALKYEQLEEREKKLAQLFNCIDQARTGSQREEKVKKLTSYYTDQMLISYLKSEKIMVNLDGLVRNRIFNKQKEQKILKNILLNKFIFFGTSYINVCSALKGRNAFLSEEERKIVTWVQKVIFTCHLEDRWSVFYLDGLQLKDKEFNDYANKGQGSTLCLVRKSGLSHASIFKHLENQIDTEIVFLEMPHKIKSISGKDIESFYQSRKITGTQRGQLSFPFLWVTEQEERKDFFYGKVAWKTLSVLEGLPEFLFVIKNINQGRLLGKKIKQSV